MRTRSWIALIASVVAVAAFVAAFLATEQRGPSSAKAATPILPTAAELVATMVDPGASWEARCLAEDSLAAFPPIDVLPPLFQARASHQRPRWICNSSGVREIDRSCPVDSQIGFAIGRVWEANTEQLACESRGQLMLQLLMTAQTSHEIGLIASEFGRCWVPEAEPHLAELLSDDQANVHQRVAAGSVLVRHGTARDYREVLLRNATVGELEDRVRWFDVLTRSKPVNSEEIDPRLLRIGFVLVADHHAVYPDYPHAPYFVAMTVGAYVGAEYRPDQSKPEYQGPHGLADAFFADTVANALAWWGANKDRIEREIAEKHAEPEPERSDPQ